MAGDETQICDSIHEQLHGQSHQQQAHDTDFGLVILTSYKPPGVFEHRGRLIRTDPCRCAASKPRLNESLILAQNQRWRRA